MLFSRSIKIFLVVIVLSMIVLEAIPQDLQEIIIEDVDGDGLIDADSFPPAPVPDVPPEIGADNFPIEF